MLAKNPIALSSHTLSFPNNQPRFHLSRNPKRYSHFSCVLKVGFEEIAEILHNKALIAAGVSAAIGQLSKPFTSVLLYGKDFNLRSAFQAGGFPSTHSSSVVAAATALALERGFSDSIVGLSIVYAGLIMYDAQGVRREVGIHARVVNKLVSNSQVKLRNDGINSQPGELRSLSSTLLSKGSSSLNRNNGMNMSSSGIASEVEEETESYADNSLAPLKESIGHTEVEVVAGALLGLSVSLAVYAIL